MATTIRMLTETGPRFVGLEEWDRLDADSNRVVFRNGRYGFNCYGFCIEGAETAVRYEVGDDEVWIETCQSPNGRYSYSLFYRLLGFQGRFYCGFCWDENCGYKGRKQAVTAALEQALDVVKDLHKPIGSPYVDRSFFNIPGRRARMSQVKKYLEKKLDFWDPAVTDILKID